MEIISCERKGLTFSIQRNVLICIYTFHIIALLYLNFNSKIGRWKDVKLDEIRCCSFVISNLCLLCVAVKYSPSGIRLS